MRYPLFLVGLLLASVAVTAQKDSTDLTGTWRWVLDKDQPGFTFTKEGYVYILRGDKKEGGAPLGNTNGKVFLKYKATRAADLFHIEIIAFEVIDNQEVVVKEKCAQGIYTYLKDGRIKISVPLPGVPRPTKFVTNDSFILTKLE